MSLLSGATLGPYQILSPLGAGGMGEVYLARDTRLDREVAIKVLPEAMARDPERMARFQREAKLLASLNHPNIAALFVPMASLATVRITLRSRVSRDSRLCDHLWHGVCLVPCNEESIRITWTPTRACGAVRHA